MTNRADPKDPQLAKWIAEGLNIDVHTFDHPCPCLQKGDFAQARRTYEQCVDLMASIPNNRPVAFRMPCCDSLNTPSPRFWTEIFNKTTTSGGRLVIDSSVFNIVTPQDKSLPAEWTLLDGGERFRRYIPFPSFVNTIENYPYPYLIGRQCWEFPCVVPSDWEAQNIQQSNNPATVRDMKIALDVTVKKQGVYNLVFHPHSWIRNDQVIQLIDHAQQKYGDKVKFLSFREAAERLEKSLLSGQPLRDASGAENGVRLLDLNADGYLDVVIGNRTTRLSRVWSPADMRWIDSVFPADIRGGATRFGVIDGRVVAIQSAGETRGAWAFDNGRWTADRRLLAGLEADGAAISTIRDGLDRGVRLRDLDNDGRCELLVSNDQQNIVFHWSGQRWRRATYRLPPGMEVVDDRGRDAGLRFVDINEDGFADAIFSNEQRYALHLWNGRKPASGWSIEALRGDRTDDGAIPMIARQGRNNGAWFHSRSMWIQNEDTSRLPDLVDRRSFAQLLEKHHGDQPPPKTIQQSLRTFEFPPDLQLELVAAEPLIADPVAFDWSPDGSLWVAEMGDYPLGVDGFGKPGGRVRRLTDTDGDGVYDQSELFLDGVRFPTGVKVWRNGVLVSTAPDLFYAEDTDGDGRADKRQILFTGFVEGNQQHRVNGLRWGLDNWLYLANGDSGGEIKSTQTGKVLNIRGRDLRVRPDTGEMNALAGQTQFGRNRDDWGNWFGGNNSNPMWHYVLEDYVTRRNPLLPTPDVRRAVSVQPGAAPVFPSSRTLTRFNDFDRVDRFTSACSPIIYRDAWLGDSYRGNAFIAEPVHNLVHREIVEAVGDSFTSHRAERDRNNEFLRSRDNWFRPTMVRTGPDGSLWIADMYRLVIEHPKWIPQEWQRRLDLRSGSDRGRIYRLKPRGKTTPPAAGRALRGLQPNDLVAELSSGNGWRRDMAQQLIVLSQDRKYIVPLEQLAAASKLPLARLHALCALDSFGPPRAEVLLPRLNDSHPGVRRHAVRIAGLHATTDERVVAALAKLADTETDARVQIEIAVALGSIRQEAAGAALGRLTARMRPHQFRFTAALSSIDEDNIGDVIAAALGTDEAAMNPELVEPLLTLAGAMGNREIVNDLLSSWLGSAQPLTQKAATLAA
ncbi:MAG: FG-GAP-like repeat-containing protein, partial [Pirellulaceae bacterium]|nr:FG-GAP-like repeat-containing protein [Pirellulaceae bacterium]